MYYCTKATKINWLHHPSKFAESTREMRQLGGGGERKKSHVHLIELLVDLLDLLQIREQLPHDGAVREREQLGILKPAMKQKAIRRSPRPDLASAPDFRRVSEAYDAIHAGEEGVAGLGGWRHRERRYPRPSSNPLPCRRNRSVLSAPWRRSRPGGGLRMASWRATGSEWRR